MKTLIAVAAFCALTTAAQAAEHPLVLSQAGTKIRYIVGHTERGSFLFEPYGNSGIGALFPLVIPHAAFAEDGNGALVSALNTEQLGDIAFEQW